MIQSNFFYLNYAIQKILPYPMELTEITFKNKKKSLVTLISLLSGSLINLAGRYISSELLPQELGDGQAKRLLFGSRHNLYAERKTLAVQA